MPNKILFGLAATAAILLSACGDEITEVTEVNEVGMMVIEKGEALPKCSSDNEGALVYSVDSAQAYYCVSRKWKTLNGKDGADGKDGKDGEKGDKGDTGKKGDKGDTGDKGDPGEKGEQGDTGEQGPKGEQGAKGDKGEDGSSCTVELLPDSSGYKVICDDDSIGVILNGTNGEKGDRGEKGDEGDKGNDGKNCSLNDDGKGRIEITCGDDDEQPVTFYKAMCGKIPYDPDAIAPIYCAGGKFYMKDNRDKRIYKVAIIGSQIWMAENLNLEYKVKTEVSNEESYGNICYTDNCETYGRYYTWAAAMDSAAVYSDKTKGCGYIKTCTIETPVRGICPEGWHLPTPGEWNKLYSAVKQSPYALQAEGFTEWPDATDAYGFSALPAGIYSSNMFYSVGYTYTRFWCATEVSEYFANFWILRANGTMNDGGYKDEGLSVRCIKD